MIGVPLLVAVIAFWFWFAGGRYVSTDNAYIHAAKLMISSDVSGIVSDVLVHEGQTVRQGDMLFRIDPERFKIALDNAKAQLAQTALNLESMKQDYQRMLSDAAAAGASRACANLRSDVGSDKKRRCFGAGL